jgi:3-oxoacyl-[acyl-carrier-protein] synthase II
MGASGHEAVAITGMAAACGLGHGTPELLDKALRGQPAFAPVTRFDASRCRSGAAAQLPGSPDLAEELTAAVDQACATAGLYSQDRAATPLLIALHTDPAAARDPATSQITGGTAAQVAEKCGLAGPVRTYTTACVAASTAVIDAGVMITSGLADRVVVAAGFLVDEDCHRLFDAGRVLAPDGCVRPFSKGRRGMLLGDGIAAVVLEPAHGAAGRGAAGRGAGVLAWLAGWGRSCDAYHVCQPRPDGTGLARAITMALRRAGMRPAEIGYINASGTGTSYSDASEAAALHRAFGPLTPVIPVSSTKSVHGHALEASALLELVVTVLALRHGQLPVNAGFLEPAPECELALVLPGRQPLSARYAMSLNAAFGGANTALVVSAP